MGKSNNRLGMNSFRETRLTSNEAVGEGSGDGVTVIVGVEVMVGVKVMVGVEDGSGVNVGGIGVVAGAHPIIVITRRTSANTDKENLFMTLSPFDLIAQDCA